MTRGRILLVDDDADLRLSTAQALDLAGFDVIDTDQPEDVPALTGFGFPGIVVTDIRMPRLDGLSLMTQIHALDPAVPVILITGHGDVQLAVRAMREGAHDFIEKPFSASQLAETCARALDYRRLVLENRVLRAAAGQADDLEQRLVGRSTAMIDLRRRLRTIGPAETDVLITGDTGTGKEVVARALHDLSARAAKPFIAIDCAALPEQQIESELFGHEQGAFAGAMRARYGRFEHARGGTVLLDDIGSMPMAMQGKLLRVIQERTVTPLGANEARPVDIRVIATSRAALEPEVEAGRFRADRSGMEESGEFIALFNPPLRMLIVGAVHIAQALVPMARLAGYDPVLIDPRDAFASENRFPDTAIRHDWPDEGLLAEGLDARTAVVTLTHDTKLDDPAIIAALNSEAFYLGCLGSSRTHAKRLERLRAAGVTEDQIARIHAPVGLDIGAKTPAEIAVSVLAQVTQVLRQA